MELGKQRSFVGEKILQVNKRVITFGDSIICADNISLITVSTTPANWSWIGAICLLVLSVPLLASKWEVFQGVGAYMLTAAIIWLIVVIIINASRSKYLVINLNSGMSLHFYCKNKEFLNKVVQELTVCINDNKAEPITIRFDSCKISGGNFFDKSKIG